jgi:phenylacetate-CoA ligase
MLPAEIIFDQLTNAFAASQNFKRDEVRKRQAVLLERLVRHANEYVPFYRASRRLAPLFRADGRFDFQGWSDVPVLTRTEAHDNEQALQASIVPADMGVLTARSTSGSTGTPLRFRQTFLQQVASEVLLNRTLRWHKCWPIVRIASVAGGSQPASPAPGMLVLPGAASFKEQVSMLREHKTTHVIVAPNIAAAWADAAEKALPYLKTVLATGEVLRPEMRRKIERKLGAKVINLYSASELGPIAAEAPDGRFRINEETLFVDSPPGELDPESPERLVVTPLYAFGTPLIRYAPGDYITFSSTLAGDARGLRRLDRVVGRQRNLFLRPDGSLFLPGRFVAHRLQEIVSCREWQLVQNSSTEVELKIVVTSAPGASQLTRLQKYLQECLPDHATKISLVDAIENNMRSGKSYEMFLSLVAPPQPG